MSGISLEENKFVKGVNHVGICPKDSFGDLSNSSFGRDALQWFDVESEGLHSSCVAAIGLRLSEFSASARQHSIKHFLSPWS
jgi:hypothetical protein